MSVRFGILGPLQIVDDGTERPVTAGRDRALLAALLLSPGRIVGTDRLLEALWEGDPPATARGQLQNCISRLRRLLPPDKIITDPAGYGIHVEGDELDAAVFTRLTAAARSQPTPDEARRMLRQALDLWRGPALAGIDAAPIRSSAAILDEQRAVATEDWVDLELSGGRERNLLPELAGTVERFPLRERLRGQLMLALCRAGRQADALAEYRRARALLHDELGIEPGPALRDLHRRILTGEVGPTAAETAPARAAARTLPRTVGDFTGRSETVERLVRAIEDGDPGGPIIKVIDGMAGSGKTTLALHVANLVAHRYPDGQLFVDLHGHSERRPVEPAAVLVTLLRQLGVGAERIPGDLDGRVALWRSELAARRALVVLDNAASTAQVAPLLPAARGCLALVTSRRRLAGLDGVRPESIPLLTEQEGVELLARIAADRVSAEPDAAAEVVRRCGRLPLAIRLAGSRLAHRQRWRVADLVRRLGEHGTALPELAAEDRTVVSAFALSYGQLDDRERRMFRLLGLHPGERFDATAAAALTGLPLDTAEDVLDDLVDMHLVEEPERGLFRLHDLMREYAATLAAQDAPQDRQDAVVALLDYHVHAVAHAVAAQDHAHTQLGENMPMPQPGRPELLDSLGDPEAWLERERPALPRLADAAVAVGRPDFAWLLVGASWDFLFDRGYVDDILELGQRGAAAAREAGDQRALAVVLSCLASANYRLSRYPVALEQLRESAQLRRGFGDRRGEVAMLGNLSSLHESVGELAKALDTSRRALQLRRRLRDDAGIVMRQLGLAIPLLHLEEYREAQRHLRAGLLLTAESGRTARLAMLLSRLGMVRIGLREYPQAERLLRAALAVSRHCGYALGRAEALTGLGQVSHARGDYAGAIELHESALALSSQLGDPRSRCIALNDLGRALAAAGRPDEAVARYREALDVASAIHHPHGEARALDGLADVLAASDPAEARRLLQRALVVYARMGVPAKDRIGPRLSRLRGAEAPR
jgi:DNA-binding SARP family transcriptional activator/tetratricopeptide (TPR) repeat protein